MLPVIPAMSRRAIHRSHVASSAGQQALPVAPAAIGTSLVIISSSIISMVDIETEAEAIFVKRGSGRRHQPRVPLAALAS